MTSPVRDTVTQELYVLGLEDSSRPSAMFETLFEGWLISFDSVSISGYPTITIHRRRLAVSHAHLVEIPAAVGSRYGVMASIEGKL